MYSGVSMYRYSCHTAQIHTSAVPNKVITTAVLQYISWRTSYSRLDWPFAPSHSSSEYYATYNRSSHYGLAMARSSRFGSIIAHSYPVIRRCNTPFAPSGSGCSTPGPKVLYTKPVRAWARPGYMHVFHTRFRYGANLAYNNNSLTHYARGTPLSYWTLAAHRSAGSGSISLVIYILFTVPLLYLFAIAVTWF